MRVHLVDGKSFIKEFFLTSIFKYTHVIRSEAINEPCT